MVSPVNLAGITRLEHNQRARRTTRGLHLGRRESLEHTVAGFLKAKADFVGHTTRFEEGLDSRSATVPRLTYRR